MKTMEYEVEGTKLKLERLSFNKMRELHEDVLYLYTAESPTDVLFSPEFEKVMKAAAASEEDYAAIMGELDQVEAWELWEKFCDFQRLEAFFSDAADSQTRRQVKLAEIKSRNQMAQIDMMKKSGLVPADFSLSDMMHAEMKKALGKALEQSSLGSEKEEPKAEKKSKTKP